MDPNPRRPHHRTPNRRREQLLTGRKRGATGIGTGSEGERQRRGGERRDDGDDYGENGRHDTANDNNGGTNGEERDGTRPSPTSYCS
jgi:hypothetical protein